MAPIVKSSLIPHVVYLVQYGLDLECKGKIEPDPCLYRYDNTYLFENEPSLEAVKVFTLNGRCSFVTKV